MESDRSPIGLCSVNMHFVNCILGLLYSQNVSGTWLRWLEHLEIGLSKPDARG